MSSSASQSPALSFGPTATFPTATSFQSSDAVSGHSSSYTGSSSYPNNSFRMKGETSSFNYDEQAPRSQQPHGNYIHHDPSHMGSLAQTQALGASGQQYGESSRSVGGGHFFPQHTRHSSLASSIGHLGLSNSEPPSAVHDDPSGLSSYGAYNNQRTGLGAGAILTMPETSPSRSRFPMTTNYPDTRQTARSQPGRPVGLGFGLPGGSDAISPKFRGHGALPDGSTDSPRSLKRAAEHLEDPRGSTDHSNQLRRPASFPVINASANMSYGRPLQADSRSSQTLGRNRGRGGPLAPGQTTPGRPSMLLPASYGEDGRRDSFGSSQAIQSPFVGSSTSSEDLPPQYPMGGFPQLVRSTQIPGATGAPGSLGNDSTYSPPSMADAPKARLELHGNLNDMAVGWSHDEWRSGRRLVQFWRRQEGPVIHATWRPISPSQYVPNSIVISCIFRDEKNECFVTSVDTIYLLEALVASRFTVEEKNRIRRNLEGFRPITVSKSKRECDAFFKRIMSFPNPKPRNIEKDVKVFPWKVLASALCKIISKYSPLYDSSMMLSEPWAPELGPSPPMVGAPGMVDIGRYRDAEYPPAPASAPAFRDDQYERQGYPGGSSAYGPPHGGGAGSGPMYAPMYGTTTNPPLDLHSRSRSTGSTFAFQELMPGHPGTGQMGLGHGGGALGGYPTAGPTETVAFPTQGGDPGYAHQGGAVAGYAAFPSEGAGATGTTADGSSGVAAAAAATTAAGANPTTSAPVAAGTAADEGVKLEPEGIYGQAAASLDQGRSGSLGHHRDMSGSTLAGATGYYSERRG
ncbi:hypothetical protein ACQY0O_007901 [Thecaphora frezii]